MSSAGKQQKSRIYCDAGLKLRLWQVAWRRGHNARPGGPPGLPHICPRRFIMAKKEKEAVYRVTDVIGTSSESWEAAARAAVNTASKSLRDLRIAEVTKLDVKIDNGKVTQFRTRLSLSFKYGA
jgi:flavin-binding protein dodecin